MYGPLNIVLDSEGLSSQTGWEQLVYSVKTILTLSRLL